MAYTPLWGTGFEMGSTAIVVASDITGTVTIETGTKHTGSYALKIYGATSPDGVFQIALPEAQTEIYVSAWLNASDDAAELTRFQAMTSDGYLVGIYNNSAQWNAYVNGALAEEAAVGAAGGSWHLVEMYVKIDDVAGSIQTKIDGVADIDYTGDTKPGTGTTITKLEMRQTGSVSHNPSFYVDDITIATGDWIGDVRYDIALVPTADTVQKEWTPSSGSLNYALLDELPPSDADYVSTGSTGYKDLYELGDWSPAEETYNVEFLVDWIRAKKGTAADQQIRSVVLSGATEDSGGSILLSTVARGYQRILATDPDTSSPWDTDGVNALQVGQEYL